MVKQNMEPTYTVNIQAYNDVNANFMEILC